MKTRLKAGRVYRTRDFRASSSNPTRLVSRLVSDGRLVKLRKGLYQAPKQAFWGDVPPSESQLLAAFFSGKPYLRTGPSVWNSLGLGTTAVEVAPLVYNTTRTGTVELGGRPFELRRVRFPVQASPEFLVVDLLQNMERVDASRDEVLRRLRSAVLAGRFDAARLEEAAERFGTEEVGEQLRQAVAT